MSNIVGKFISCFGKLAKSRNFPNDVSHLANVSFNLETSFNHTGSDRREILVVKGLAVADCTIESVMVPFDDIELGAPFALRMEEGPSLFLTKVSRRKGVTFDPPVETFDFPKDQFVVPLSRLIVIMPALSFDRENNIRTKL